MPAIVQGATNADLVAELFRRNPPDPNAPPRPRPVLDAIKNLLTGLVGELGPVLTPMILDLLKKLLSGAGTASNAVALTDAHEFEIVDELLSRHSASVADATIDAQDRPLLDAIRQFLVGVIGQIGPQLSPFLIGLLKRLLAPAV